MRRAPYHETLVAYVELLEAERIDALVAQGQEVHRAVLTNYAIGNVDALAAEQAAYHASLAHAPGETAATVPVRTREEFLSYAERVRSAFDAGHPLPES